MKSQSNTRVISILRISVSVASIFAIGVGLLVLVGWILNIAPLKSILPDAATMKFNTALCFLLSGISLWLLKNEEGKSNIKYTGKIFAGLVVLISIATIGEYLFGWDLGIDQFVIKDLATLPSNFPGRMSGITAACFALSGIALLLIDISFSQYFSLSVILLSLLAAIGYLFDYQALYQLGGYDTVALHTAITFLILSVAIFFARPHLGLMKISIGELAGSRTIRLLVPFIVLLAILLGWLVEKGQDIHIFNPDNKVVILVVLFIVIYSPLIYFYAGRINHADEQIIRLNRLYATLSQVNQTIVHIKDQEELFENICKVAVEHGGFTLAWIGLLDESTGEVRPVTAVGLDIDQWPFPIVNIHHGELKDGLIASAIRTSKVTTSDDIQSNNRLASLYRQFKKFAYHSSAAVPFRLKGKTIGIMSLVSSEMGFFKSKEEVRLLDEMGLDISFALDTIQQETERRQSEERFQLAIESAPNAIILTDKVGQITLINAQAETYFGYRPDELVGKSVEILVAERLRNNHIAYRAGFLEKPQARPMGKGRDLYGLRKNGSEFPVEIGLAPFETSEGILVMATVVDITERKQSEEKILRQNRRLETLREIDTAILSVDTVENIVGAALEYIRELVGSRRAALTLFDQKTNEAVIFDVKENRETPVSKGTRMPMALFENMGKSLIENHLVLINELADMPVPPPQFQALLKSGLHSACILPLYAQDQLIGTFGMFSEQPGYFDEERINLGREVANQVAIAISQNRLMENLRVLNEELEQRVEERTRELNQTNIELEHANQAKSNFLATMSHELRSPLNSILGLSESLLEQRRDPLSEYQQQSLKIVTSSGRHLLDLINDILDLSKIEAGKLDYYPQPVNIKALCQSSISFVKGQAILKSIHLEFDESKADFKIHADPRRLKQILVNLLANAVKFTGNDGQVTLKIYADAEEDLVQFSVIDNGIGIADEDLAKLFQPFVQVDNDLDRRYEGTGLGLALVQRLTDLHGGSVQVESEVGKGSRFTINIPWGRAIIAQQELVESGDPSLAEKELKKANGRSTEERDYTAG